MGAPPPREPTHPANPTRASCSPGCRATTTASAPRLSFGQDPRWRRGDGRGARRRPGRSACSTWRPARGWSRRSSCAATACAVVGLDQSPEMLAAARARLARDAELATRVTLVEGEAERLPFADGEFDHLTFTYLLRYVEDPAATLRELARVVAPGGRIASLEFGVPAREPLARAVERSTRASACPRSGALVSREWAQVGRFLARSIPDFYARHPLAGARSALWSAAGIEARAGRVDELRRGRRDVGHGEMARARRRRLSARRSTRCARGLARPRHAAASALHGVAPQLRRDRRRDGAAPARGAPAGGAWRRSCSAVGVSARTRSTSSTAGRCARTSPTARSSRSRGRARRARWRSGSWAR